MITVALTGGLASGKSFVAATMQRLGCHVIEADRLGHEVLGAEAYQAVIAEFGSGILEEQAEVIDRRKLAAEVFGDPERLAKLAGIVHPHVRARIKCMLAEIERDDPRGIAVVEAAIHIETGGYRDYTRTVLVWCRPEQQIERATARGLSEQEARARVQNQMPVEEKRKLAHFVIDTSGTKEATVRQTEEVVNQLRSIPQ